MTRWLRISVAVMALLFVIATSAKAADSSLILAVHPYLPVAELQKRFVPLADYLSREIGQTVTVRIGSNYDAHIDAIGKNEVDIAFMGPASYVQMLNKYGSKPLLARFEVDGSPNLYGVIFTRKESPLHTLSDLKGKRFAFGDPESTMSHIVPRYMLMEAGIPVSSLADSKFLGSHNNVALAVLAGDFDAGAVKREVFDEFQSKGLQLLATTPATPDHLFVTRSDLPEGQVKKLREALLKIKDQGNGREILMQIHKKLTNLIPASEKDYEQLRVIVNRVESSR